MSGAILAGGTRTHGDGLYGAEVFLTVSTERNFVWATLLLERLIWATCMSDLYGGKFCMGDFAERLI